MNKFILYLLMSIVASVSFSQNIENKTLPGVYCSDIKENQLTFINPETKLIYKGGSLKLINDLKLNLIHPTKGCIQGSVYVRFIIDTLERLTNVSTAKGLNKQCDKEAIRVVKLLDNWTPRTKRGKKIKVSYTIPVNFKFREE